MNRLLLCALAVLLFTGGEASAQSPYVGASVFGDIVRVSGSRSVVGGDTGGGEAIGFTLRVGTPLGDRWGVEAEYARPNEIDEGLPFNILPTSFAFNPLSVAAVAGTALPPNFTPFSYKTTSRHTTISAAAWIRQDFTARSSLVYLGGLGFFRSTHDFETSFDPRALLGGSGVSILPYSTETIIYGVRPFVGLEGRIGLGEHAQLVPGFRFHALDDAWLLRPSVGLNWMF